ncbi:hypothetical protein IEQ34_001724 [Dendrobium chrysotoxum]|uniref:Uncharacterized protein n=1 Tax=Dendrobium chrysotoxum TaxID=161865 RepID=A0AAV7HNH8_DENCH|nr:hypothetical protein IEQ34_001724 [Dendrobium chrysotoxum]
MQYEAEFTLLFRYAPHLIPAVEEKCYGFLLGLNRELRHPLFSEQAPSPTANPASSPVIRPKPLPFGLTESHEILLPLVAKLDRTDPSETHLSPVSLKQTKPKKSLAYLILPLHIGIPPPPTRFMRLIRAAQALRRELRVDLYTHDSQASPTIFLILLSLIFLETVPFIGGDGDDFARIDVSPSSYVPLGDFYSAFEVGVIMPDKPLSLRAYRDR